MLPSEALAAADPMGRILAWLDTHPKVVAAGAGGRVGLRNEAPYPRLVVTDPPGLGGDGEVRWGTSRDVQVEVLGDLDGSPGKALLARLSATAVGALLELPEQDTPPGGPVITAVRLQSGGWVPLADGQPRYLSLLRVWSHPLKA